MGEGRPLSGRGSLALACGCQGLPGKAQSTVLGRSTSALGPHQGEPHLISESFISIFLCNEDTDLCQQVLTVSHKDFSSIRPATRTLHRKHGVTWHVPPRAQGPASCPPSSGRSPQGTHTGSRDRPRSALVVGAHPHGQRAPLSGGGRAVGCTQLSVLSPSCRDRCSRVAREPGRGGVRDREGPSVGNKPRRPQELAEGCPRLTPVWPRGGEELSTGLCPPRRSA